MAAAQQTTQAVRRWIMTGAVTAITITGTLYGAGLKDGHELQQKREQALQSSPEEMIAQLEVARNELVIKKTALERKITTFRRRREEQEQGFEPETKGR